MERASREAEVVEAAAAWVRAKRAWEATTRATVRPPNLSRLKGDVGRAERRLMAAVDALGLVDPPGQNEEDRDAPG